MGEEGLGTRKKQLVQGDISRGDKVTRRQGDKGKEP
jgi:hypothetical protein